MFVLICVEIRFSCEFKQFCCSYYLALRMASVNNEFSQFSNCKNCVKVEIVYLFTYAKHCRLYYQGYNNKKLSMFTSSLQGRIVAMTLDVEHTVTVVAIKLVGLLFRYVNTVL